MEHFFHKVVLDRANREKVDKRTRSKCVAPGEKPADLPVQARTDKDS